MTLGSAGSVPAPNNAVAEDIPAQVPPLPAVAEVPVAVPDTTAMADVEAQVSMQIQIQVPEDCGPGRMLNVTCPDGTTLQVVVPPGAQPGQILLVALPDAPCKALQAAPLDARTECHLSGGCGKDFGWVTCWVCTYVFIAGCSIASSWRPSIIAITWLCTVASTLIVPSVAYLCLGRPDGISLGLLLVGGNRRVPRRRNR